MDSLKNLLESLIIAAILIVIYWVIGFIILKIFKKEIRKKSGYVFCIPLGILLKWMLIIFLNNTG